MPVLDLADFAAALPARAPVAGLDLGEKTIGVAVSDATRIVASPLETIRKSKFTDDAGRLFALMDSRGAAGIVIGLPVNMDGTEGTRCQSNRAFARNLLRLRAPPIALWGAGVADVDHGGQPHADRRDGRHPRPPRRSRRQGRRRLDPPGRAGAVAGNVV